LQVAHGTAKPLSCSTSERWQTWTIGHRGFFARDGLRSYPAATFAGLAAVRHHRPVITLDVRRNLEWAESHLDGAVHIPLHELPGRLSEVPPGEIWVHCHSGYRASVAASFLDAAGCAVVAIDDDYANAAGTGLRLVTPDLPVTPAPGPSRHSRG